MQKRKNTATLILSVVLAVVLKKSMAFTVSCGNGAPDEDVNDVPNDNVNDATAENGDDALSGSTTEAPDAPEDSVNNAPGNNVNGIPAENGDALSDGTTDAPTENINGEAGEGFAPDFSVELLTGETFTLSEQRGKVVLINFWATWCGPCVAKMPRTQELFEQYQDDVVFIGVNAGEDRNVVNDFISAGGYTFNIGLDSDMHIIQHIYPAVGIPYTVIINADGTIADDFLGGGDQIGAEIENAIIEAING